MNISSLSFDTAAGMLQNKGFGEALTGGQKDQFSDILTDAMHMAEDAEHDSKVSALELVTGETDDIANVMISSEKAELALNLTVQVRNKVVDAYNEIMNMQV